MENCHIFSVENIDNGVLNSEIINSYAIFSETQVMLVPVLEIVEKFVLQLTDQLVK